MPWIRTVVKTVPGMERMHRLSLNIPLARHYKHVALVIKGGAIIAAGMNLTRHAEVAALLSLFPSDRSGVKVISVRIRKDGSFAMAKPCSACEKFMRESGVKKVTWSDSDGVFHTERYR
jgi:cytidine deaminase